MVKNFAVPCGQPQRTSTISFSGKTKIFYAIHTCRRAGSLGESRIE